MECPAAAAALTSMHRLLPRLCLLAGTTVTGQEGDHVAHVALLGAGVISVVRNSENAGRTLRHEFLALVVVSSPLVAGKAELVLPWTTDQGVARHAIAAWVTRREDLTPMQAAGGWID